MNVEIKTADKLTDKEIEIINTNRLLEFHSKRPLDIDKDDLFFFLLDDKREILSFGRIDNLKIKFHEQEYIVLRVSTMISIVKHHGYGTLIVKAMQEHAKESDILLLGFCETSLIPFYRHCGFSILESSDNQFVYTNQEGEIIPNIVPGEIFYMDSSEKLMEMIIGSEDKTVKIER